MQANQQTVTFIMMIGFIALFYFMLIRPQKQQQKKREDMLNSLAVGDKILTVGGVYGQITEIKENSIRVKVAKDVVLRMTKSGVQNKTTNQDD